MSNRVVFTDFRAAQEAKGIEVEMPDGSCIRIPPPTLWPDGAMKYAQAGDNEKLGESILGEKDYDRWVSFGGTSALLAEIITERHGVSVGESSASSSS